MIGETESQASIAMDLPLPPPDQRQAKPNPSTPVEWAVALIEAHATAVAAVTLRNPADFSPIPVLVSDVIARLAQAFVPGRDLPPSLVAELAPLLWPRLERLNGNLRQRLARSRRLLPLAAVREMNPACLRTNARRPGKDLIEKAGPRQQLWGVVRVVKHDTMENRVLAAACNQLLARAKVQTQMASDQDHPNGKRFKDLKRLRTATTALLECEALVSIGLPRAGERPSNALLGDADYRAAWRAWQLMRKQDESYRDLWHHRGRVWTETCLLAAWATLDANRDFEPMPNWVQATDAGEDGSRLHGDHARCWISVAGELAEVVSIRMVPGMLEVTRQIGVLGEAAERSVQHLDLLSTRPEEPWLSQALRISAAVVPHQSPRAATRKNSAGRRVGLCALDAQAVACDESGLRQLGPAAAGELLVSAGETLTVVGRDATWLSQSFGPADLVCNRPDLGGALLNVHAGQIETAVVVPDRMDEMALGQMRQRMGRIWTVWSPVAAALAAAEQHCATIDRAMEDSPFMLVVTATDASFDVAVLEQEFEPMKEPARSASDRRFWIRSEPLAGDASGAQHRTNFNSRDAVGAWLRNPQATEGWAVRDATPCPVGWTPSAQFSAQDVLERVRLWRGGRPALAVTVGLCETTVKELEQSYPVIVLNSDDLAKGAHVFLERHRAGLPTWKDRLPEIAVAARAGGLRKPITLIPKGTLVAPGDPVHESPTELLEIPLGAQLVSFSITREGREMPYRVEISGPPLPLRAPCAVRIELNYRYGLDGMSGTVVPVGSAPFERIPFHLSAATGELKTESALVEAPPFPAVEPVPESTSKQIRDAFRTLQDAWQKLPEVDRNKSPKNPQIFDKHLRPVLKNLAESLKLLGGVGPLAGDGIRMFMLDKVVPWLDWLLGFGGRKGDGKPPRLTREAKLSVARCRAATGLRGAADFGTWLLSDDCDLDQRDRMLALGKTIEGNADELWISLIEWPCETDMLRSAQAEAVDTALWARPELAAADITAAESVLAQLHAALQELVANGRALKANNAQLVYILLAPIPKLCFARAAGGLQLANAEVIAATEALRQIREKLPPEVRKFGGKTLIAKDDEPISLAIAYLSGDYSQLPAQRSR